MNIEYPTQANQELLQNYVLKLNQIDNAKEWGELIGEAGSFAWKIYRGLKKADISVLMPVEITHQRARNCEIEPTCPGYWFDFDILVAFCEYLDLLNFEEVAHGKE